MEGLSENIKIKVKSILGQGQAIPSTLTKSNPTVAIGVTLKQRSHKGQAISLTLEMKVNPNVNVKPPNIGLIVQCKQDPATSGYSVYVYICDLEEAEEEKVTGWLTMELN